MSPKKTRRRAIGVELSVTCAGRQAGGFSEPAGGDSEFPDGAAGPITVSQSGSSGAA